MIGLGSDKNRQRKRRQDKVKGKARSERMAMARRPRKLSLLSQCASSFCGTGEQSQSMFTQGNKNEKTFLAVTMTKAKQNQIFGHNIGGHPEIQCKGNNQFSR